MAQKAYTQRKLKNRGQFSVEGRNETVQASIKVSDEVLAKTEREKTADFPTFEKTSGKRFVTLQVDCSELGECSSDYVLSELKKKRIQFVINDNGEISVKPTKRGSKVAYKKELSVLDEFLEDDNHFEGYKYDKPVHVRFKEKGGGGGGNM